MPKLIITVDYDEFDRKSYLTDKEGNGLTEEQQEALTELQMLELDLHYVKLGEMGLIELIDYGYVDLENIKVVE